jgi:hypothetical protein
MEECFPDQLSARYTTQTVLRKAAESMAPIMGLEIP